MTLCLSTTASSLFRIQVLVSQWFKLTTTVRIKITFLIKAESEMTSTFHSKIILREGCVITDQFGMIDSET